ncbi:HD domain-containing protein [bacterium]|nr:HD domain-containing protein [bacterium]
MPTKQNMQENIENAHVLLNKSIESYSKKKWKNALTDLSLAYKVFLAHKKIDYVSICLSLTALIKYLSKSEGYYNSLMLLEDAKFLSDNAENREDSIINRFAFAEVYYYEKKYSDALLYLTNIEKELNDFPILKARATELIETINNKPQKTQKNKSQLDTTLVLALSNIARAVNAETNIDKLLITIAEQTKFVLNADRCTVFLYDKEKNELWSKVALGLESSEIRFCADKGIAGAVVKKGKTVRIKDAYRDKRFNPDIDKITGYKTYNMLCMPIHNIKYEIIGVFQVLNKKSGNFTDSDEDILFAIGTNAGIAIENNLLLNIQQNMLEEQTQMFESLMDALAVSIDAKDSLTLGHSARVRLYSELIAEQMGLDTNDINIISKAAMLHDIGKIGTKDAILQKQGALTKEEYEHIKEHVKITYDILCRTNINAKFKEITEIASSHHEKYNGTGYFRGLKGEEIPLGGRILAVSDVFDAITSVRHYRDRMPIKDALNIIVNGKNEHFDAKIVNAFLEITCDKITDILVSEYKMIISQKDKKLLSKLPLNQFVEILNKENPIKSEQNIINTFNKYYVRKKQEVINV